MTATCGKAYKGMAMEGLIAAWYAQNTRRDHRRFHVVAEAVAARTAPDSTVLEVAPGPGYLAIEIAKSGRRVTTLDISKSFVRMAQENASQAGVTLDVRHGNVAAMPLSDASFDFVVSMAAFKNFADPVGALNEIYRVLRPGGRASIFDLRKDAAWQDVDAEVRGMHVSAASAMLTRWIFRHWLLRKAYTREDLEHMAAESRFGRCEIAAEGIGFELKLAKPCEPS